jgi:hypothetical protein
MISIKFVFYLVQLGLDSVVALRDGLRLGIVELLLEFFYSRTIVSIASDSACECAWFG